MANLRRAAGSVVDDQPVVGAMERSAGGIGYSVPDDGSDQAELAERAEAAERAALAQLRARVEALNAAVDQIARG